MKYQQSENKEKLKNTAILEVCEKRNESVLRKREICIRGSPNQK